LSIFLSYFRLSKAEPAAKICPVMIIDLKLGRQKAVPAAAAASGCGTTAILSLSVGGFLLLSVALFCLITIPLHSLHTSLMASVQVLPADLLLDARPRWTQERLTRRLPQCIIIGVRKSGTRALIEFLNLHPRIRKASDEIHFFDEEQNYQKGLEWYRRKMPFSYRDEITIEKSPAYFITRYVPQRIRAMNSSVKLIVVVKNPLTRVISDYTQTRTNRVKKGKNYLSFEDTVLTPDGSVDVTYKPIRVSLYYKHLTHWLSLFPRHQVMIVDGDTLVTDPVEELAKVETFLGLDHRINGSHFHYNATKGFFCIRDPQTRAGDRCLSKTKGRPHPDVSRDVVDKLVKFFRPHNEQFFAEIGRRFDWG
jgi:[heparan sulfate]-glucosamine 3-sulfotransferase 5